MKQNFQLHYFYGESENAIRIYCSSFSGQVNKFEFHTIKPVTMAKSTRRRFTSSFKTKVCLEALKERHSIEVLAKKFDIHPNQISA